MSHLMKQPWVNKSFNEKQHNCYFIDHLNYFLNTTSRIKTGTRYKQKKGKKHKKTKGPQIRSCQPNANCGITSGQSFIKTKQRHLEMIKLALGPIKES